MSIKKLLLSCILFLGVILVSGYVKATTISINPTNPKVGDTVTITVSVPNVHTSTVTANVSGAVSGTIKVVGGDLSGNPSTYSNSASYYCSKEGTINVAITSDSSAVLNGEYINVGASTSVKVTSASSGSGSSSGSSSGSNSNSSSGNSSQTDSKPAEKSSNANLSNLGIKPNDFTGFKSGTTTYNVTVPNEVDSVEVYATKADSKAKITGTGTKSLQEGENALSVVVTAENGNTKTYTINVTREAAKEEENTEEEIEAKKGLTSISINNLELNPEFATDVYEYTVKYIGEETSLDITTVPTDANYKTEILGNEELKEGENIVTILVTDAEGNNIATYQLIVNKELKAEVVENTEEKTTNDDFQKMIVIAGGIAVLIIILILIIIIRHKRNKAYAEEFSGVPFSKLKDEDEDYENELDERKRAKKEFLSGFDDNQDVIEEKVKRNKKKGKRFK